MVGIHRPAWLSKTISAVLALEASEHQTMMVIMLEMGLISPPMGVIVFVVKGITEDVPMREPSIGILPFCAAMLNCLILLVVAPDSALFLPNQTNN